MSIYLYISLNLPYIAANLQSDPLFNCKVYVWGIEIHSLMGAEQKLRKPTIAEALNEVLRIQKIKPDDIADSTIRSRPIPECKDPAFQQNAESFPFSLSYNALSCLLPL